MARNERVCERALRYEGNATLVVLDGRTGKEKTTVQLPAPADDCILFADLTGRGRREDLVVKDRYWNMWGVSHAGDILWHWPGSTGHYPAVADIDGDGRDEVFVGYALLDHDGRVIFDHQQGNHPDVHSDANAIARMSDGQWRLLFGNHGAHCLAPDGREIWHQAMREAQHVVVGRFSVETAMQAVVVDRGSPRNEKGDAVIYLFDLDTGREIWRRQEPPGGWGANCQDIRWTGRNDCQEILVAGRGAGRPAIIYDGTGEIVDELEVPAACLAVNYPNHYCYRADVWGDSRDEVFVVGWKGVRIYTNSRALQPATAYNTTLYRGM
jgi:outer membrane protein assembly factor BamB